MSHDIIPDLTTTDLGRGLLWRLVAGQSREEICGDPAVTRVLATTARERVVK